MDYPGYLALLRELTGALEQLSQVEQDKLDAARAHDLDALNRCMRQEQALSLALRGGERRRQDLARQLGLEGVPLGQLAQHFPPDCRQEAGRQAQALRRALEVARSAQAPARQLLERELRRVEAQLQQQGAAPPDEDIEGWAPAGGGPDRPSFTDIKA